MSLNKLAFTLLYGSFLNSFLHNAKDTQLVGTSQGHARDLGHNHPLAPHFPATEGSQGSPASIRAACVTHALTGEHVGWAQMVFFIP